VDARATINAHLRAQRADTEKDIVEKNIVAASAARSSPGGKVVKAKNIGGWAARTSGARCLAPPEEALCGNVSTEGINVRGVGGGVARSTGTGSLTITFKSGREGL
jgi:hypothetical protein